MINIKTKVKNMYQKIKVSTIEFLYIKTVLILYYLHMHKLMYKLLDNFPGKKYLGSPITIGNESKVLNTQ